jgi:hypothetical protein
MHEIRSVGVLQAAKFFAVLYLLISAVIIVPIAIIAMAVSSRLAGPETLVVLLVPVFYAVIGFIFTGIACWLYNLVAGMIGGLEVELRPTASAAPAPVAE